MELCVIQPLNVQKVYTRQEEHIGAYKENVYGDAVDFQSLFPALVTGVENAIESNDGLTAILLSVDPDEENIEIKIKYKIKINYCRCDTYEIKV